MSGMHQVAEHLSTEAKRTTGDVADVFGRSAFNRYYYGVFLSVRRVLAASDSKWAKVAHKDIPELLEGEFTARVRNQVTQLSSHGLIPVSTGRRRVSEASSAASELASLLRVAYRVRIAADYEPDKRVTFDRDEFALDGSSQGEARGWQRRVDRWTGVLFGVMKGIGLVH